ncbi:MAG: hypothetical protein QM820_35585 [Minicystis sp.]
MSSPKALTGLALRIVFALLGLAIAAFFGAIGTLVLRATFEESPAWAGWFLRGFVVFIFGGIAAGGLGCAWALVRGERRPAVPEAVLARCPGCGDRFGAEACARCGKDRAGCAEAWREVEREGVALVLFGGSMGAGMVCLGLFVATYGVLGDARALLALAYVALALLLVSVGGALVWGAAVAVRDAVRARGQRELTLTLATDARSISAGARLDGGALHLRGATARFAAVEAAPVAEHAAAPLPPALRAVARVLAVLHARGEASLTFAERTAWTIDPASASAEPAREITTDVMVDTAPPRVVGLRAGGDALAVPPQPVDARDIVLMAIAADVSARQIAAAVVASADLANAFEIYGRRLQGGEADERVLAVLGSVLCASAPGPAAPYRAAG